MRTSIRALWVVPSAYALAQVVTGVQCAVAAQFLMLFGDFGLAEALAIVIPLGYPVSLGQIALFTWLLNRVASGSPAPAPAQVLEPLRSAVLDRASRALSLDDGLEAAFATASVAPVRRR